MMVLTRCQPGDLDPNEFGPGLDSTCASDTEYAEWGRRYKF